MAKPHPNYRREVTIALLSAAVGLIISKPSELAVDYAKSRITQRTSLIHDYRVAVMATIYHVNKTLDEYEFPADFDFPDSTIARVSDSVSQELIKSARVFDSLTHLVRLLPIDTTTQRDVLIALVSVPSEINGAASDVRLIGMKKQLCYNRFLYATHRGTSGTATLNCVGQDSLELLRKARWLQVRRGRLYYVLNAFSSEEWLP